MKIFLQIIFLTWAFIIPCAVDAEPQTIDELVEQVRKESMKKRLEHAEREMRFKKEKEQQKAILNETNAILVTEELRSGELRRQFDINERKIGNQEILLQQRMGSLGELHGVVRQIASEIDSVLDSSLISVQKPDRDEIVDKLASSRELPAINDIERLWHIVLDEMAESGKVTTFPAPIITSAGNEIEQNVTRIGVFNAVSNGRFLRYLPESKQLAEPARQPSERFQSMALALEQADSGIVPFPIDPTRGSMLALLIQVPDLKTRIAQGGIVGAMIIILGFIGVLIAIERLIMLAMIDRKVQQQLNDEHPADNPLGRIMKIYHTNPDIDTETLGLKLDEAILKEMPALHRGLSTLALLAAIAPLLGLLGTVTGIIETFQSITLFGTGDPRTMSGGISQALVTTVMGLVTAIPLLLLHSFLSSKSNRLVHILDEKSASFVALLAESHRSK